MYPKKLFYLALCIAFCTSVSAQKKKDARDSTVTIIFSENSTTSANKKKRTGEDNIIKILPFGFASGIFPLLYERRINDWFTMEVGGGFTNRNYIRGVLIQAGDEDGTSTVKEYPWSDNPTYANNYDEAEPLYKFDHRKPEMGYMFRVEPKIYVESDAPDGGFIAFQFNKIRYNFSIPKFVDKGGSFQHAGDAVKEYEDINDFMVFWGSQYIYDRITLEYTTGIGIRKVNGEKYTATSAGSSVIDGMAPYKKTHFNFGIGISLGFHF